jgi:hypothetical protein
MDSSNSSLVGSLSFLGYMLSPTVVKNWKSSGLPGYASAFI